MNRLNRKVEYSLIALRHMGTKAKGELTTAKEIAESYGSPFDATARVLQIMAADGLLRVEHGVLGGYQLATDLKRISLKDLIEMIQGPTSVARCLHQDDQCEIQDQCNIVTPMKTLNRKLADFYGRISLHEILWDGTETRRESVARGVS